MDMGCGGVGDSMEWSELEEWVEDVEVVDVGVGGLCWWSGYSVEGVTVIVKLSSTSRMQREDARRIEEWRNAMCSDM